MTDQDLTIDQDTTNDQEVSSAIGQKKTKAKKIVKTNPMFLNKDTKINPYQHTKINKLKDFSRKNKTYIKIKLARISSSATTLHSQAQEVSNALQQIPTKLWNLDNSLILLPRNNGNNTIPLKRTMSFSEIKMPFPSTLTAYGSNQGTSSTAAALQLTTRKQLKFSRMTHVQEWLSDTQYAINIERIQPKRTCKAGHLMGYHAGIANTNNLAEAITMLPQMNGLAIEVRAETVTLGNKKTLKQDDNKKDKDIKILQIYCAWDRQVLTAMYSSIAQGQYPLGVCTRFIPDTFLSAVLGKPPFSSK
jgi:hypothetical protein